MVSDRILYITRTVPVSESTGSIKYSAQILRALCEIHCHVDVVCEEEGVDEEKSKFRVPSSCELVFYTYPKQTSIISLFSKYPYAAARLGTYQAKQKLKYSLEKSPNIIYIESFTSTWAFDIVEEYLGRSNKKPKVVYVTENDEFSTRLSIVRNYIFNPKVFGHLLDAFKIYYTDKKVTCLADAVTSISSVDFSLHSNRYKIKKGYVLHPVYRDQVKYTSVDVADTDRSVCIVGSFLWSAKKKNLSDFLKCGYAKLTKNNIKIHVVGNMSDSFLQRLRKSWPGVYFTGRVEFVEPFIENCRIGLIPEEAGGGFKLKSLQYIFNKKPIFSLVNAVVDLPLVNHKDIFLYDKMEDLVAGIIKNIDNISLLNSAKRNAFLKCKPFLEMDNTLNVLEDIEENL